MGGLDVTTGSLEATNGGLAVVITLSSPLTLASPLINPLDLLMSLTASCLVMVAVLFSWDRGDGDLCVALSPSFVSMVNFFDDLLISTEGMSILVVVFGVESLSLLRLVRWLSLVVLFFLFSSLSVSTLSFGSLLADNLRRLLIVVSALRRRGVLPGPEVLLDTCTTSGDVKPLQRHT